MRVRFTVWSLLLVLLTAGSRAGDEKPTAWKVSGELEEACSCDAACPCWFGSKPTRMNCSGGFALFIDKGTYGTVPLDGLAVAFVGQNPDNTTMMDSMGNWNFAYVYIDEKANPDQRKALEEIARASNPQFAPPERTKVRYIPITRRVDGKEHIVTLGPYGSFSGHLVDGGLGGPSKIVNSTGADPFRKEYMQGRTTRQTYNDAGQKWDWSNSNYMFTTFEVTSDDMAKYMKAMTQKMQEKAPAAGTEKKSK
ncbi:MAG TPA: DUF1326 domain-containing protein [Thermoanaerobaculia bacterium]|nr:DUF1326 domain-containing protein [Thermoanaerobaculia bacterium]